MMAALYLNLQNKESKIKSRAEYCAAQLFVAVL